MSDEDRLVLEANGGRIAALERQVQAIAEAIVRAGVVAPADLKKALHRADISGGPMGDAFEENMKVVESLIDRAAPST